MKNDLNMKDILNILHLGSSTANPANVNVVTESAPPYCPANIAKKSQFAQIYQLVESEQDTSSNPSDKIDTITVDIPLLIRLLEYAREDAKSDIDLHNVTEKLIELSKQHHVLSMEHYTAVVGDQKMLPAPDRGM